MFGAGAGRVVFGTAALRDPELVRATVASLGAERVAVALDVRDGRSIGDCLRRAPQAPAEDLVPRLADLGVRWFEVTAIDRDGLLGGPDLDLLERMVRLDRGRIIASGGIRTVDDVVAARDVGWAPSRSGPLRRDPGHRGSDRGRRRRRPGDRPRQARRKTFRLRNERASAGIARHSASEDGRTAGDPGATASAASTRPARGGGQGGNGADRRTLAVGHPPLASPR